MINPNKLNLINFQINKPISKIPVNKSSHFLSDVGDTVSFTGLAGKELKFNTALNAEIYAKNELGVNAVFENNIEIANLTINALKNVKDAGYKLPNNVIVDYEEFKNDPKREDGKELIAGVTYPDRKGGTIYLNSKFEWNNLKARMKKNFNDHNLASDNPKHFIFHEIGHFLHYIGAPDKYNKSNSASFSPKEQKLVADEVSKFASTEPCEFIAEAFSAKLLGKKYSDKTEKLYEEWGGPAPGMKCKSLNTGRISIKID
jgi:hypothetical protein